MADAHDYRRRVADIEAFTSALTAFLAVCDGGAETPFALTYPMWTPKPGHEDEAQELSAQVDRVAGRAAQAFGTDFWIDHLPREGGKKRMSPAAHWRTILYFDPFFPVEAIFSVSNQAIGDFESRAERAEEREREEPKPEPQQEPVKPKTESGGHLLRGGIVAAITSFPVLLAVAYLAHRFHWV